MLLSNATSGSGLVQKVAHAIKGNPWSKGLKNVVFRHSRHRLRSKINTMVLFWQPQTSN
jgi:hypothetical protein